MIKLLLALLFSGSLGHAAPWPSVESQEQSVTKDPSSLPADIRVFAPSKFMILPKSQAQSQIDHLTETLFTSETARQALCPIVVAPLAETEKIRDLQSLFAVSQESARDLIERCEGWTPTPAQQRSFQREKNNAKSTWGLIKTYVFVFSVSETPSISGYTDKTNTTYFLLPQRGADEVELLRILAHELAITFDQLSTLAPLNKPDVWETDELATIFDASPVFRPPPDLHALRCALRDPALRYAGMIERASRFEDRVISDLGLQNESPAVAVGDTCRRSLLHWSTIRSVLGKMVDEEATLTADECQSSAADQRRAVTLIDRLRLLEQTSLHFSKTGEKFDLCPFLVEPHLGIGQVDLFHGGPRPRIGNGWGNAKVPAGAAGWVSLKAVEEKLNNLATSAQPAEMETDVLDQVLSESPSRRSP